jgi:3',5'-cyclic-AMP phosphodiesterase
VITFVHLSDLHIDLGERATARARRLIDVLSPLTGLDAVLVTGDIADHGTPAEYELVAELLAQFEVPVLVLPGNHDVRESFGPGLLGLTPSDTEINQRTRVGEVDFLLCDSVIPGQSGGELSETTLNWLNLSLADGNGPALVAFHHPPSVLHIPVIDRIRQTGEQRLAAVLQEHPRVAGVLCGHAHTAAVTTFAGRPLVVGPGCVSTTNLPVQQSPDVVDRQTPPSYALHVLDDDARLVTHFRSA